MAVQVATLDILIERAHFDPEVARAIGDAIAMENSISRESLATKEDLVREIAELRSEMKQEFAAVRMEIAESKADVVRWMFTAMAAQLVLLTGIMYFILQQHTH